MTTLLIWALILGISLSRMGFSSCLWNVSEIGNVIMIGVDTRLLEIL